MFCASTQAYGWVAETLTHHDEKMATDKAFEVIDNGAFILGSRAIRCMLEGAIIAPECVIGTRFMGVARSAIKICNQLE